MHNWEGLELRASCMHYIACMYYVPVYDAIFMKKLQSTHDFCCTKPVVKSAVDKVLQRIRTMSMYIPGSWQFELMRDLYVVHEVTSIQILHHKEQVTLERQKIYD